MNELIRTWFNSGIMNYGVVMLTLIVLLTFFIVILKTVCEEIVPNMFRECVKYYFVYKSGSEAANRKMLLNESDSKEFVD